MGQQPGFTADKSLTVHRRRYSTFKQYRPPTLASGVALPASWVQLSQATAYGSGADGLIEDVDAGTDAVYAETDAEGLEMEIEMDNGEDDSGLIEGEMGDVSAGT